MLDTDAPRLAIARQRTAALAAAVAGTRSSRTGTSVLAATAAANHGTVNEVSSSTVRLATRPLLPSSSSSLGPVNSEDADEDDGANDGFELAIAAMGLSAATITNSGDSNSVATSTESIAVSYARTLQCVYGALAPGGHFVFGEISGRPKKSAGGARGGGLGGLSAYAHMRLMEEAGFTEVDLAWKRQDYFVCGGRKPPLFSAQTSENESIVGQQQQQQLQKQGDKTHDF